MLRSVSESARQFGRAFSYVPTAGTLLAGGNSEYRLGEMIAEGGEGVVFEIEGREELLAKVYKEADPARREKLKLMAQRGSRGLRKVCTWPITPLSDSNDTTVGFVMESLVGWEPLHNAYQIRSRLKLFPHHTYAFLVRAARNLATCVHHLHESGIVVGDMNESNVLVNAKAMVKLIDADSFQIQGPDTLYPCEVGKAELMPPELQGRSLDGVLRTPAHDRFALAVLIFQTLVYGRHPFAGTITQPLELTLEACIERGYYAYTRQRDVPVKPPPHLDLDWLPNELLELFEQAFDPSSTQRPSARAWYFALRNLENSLKTCSENPSHLYWAGARLPVERSKKNGGTAAALQPACPWCELEDRWRIALFRPALTDPDQEFEVTEVLSRIGAISRPADTGKDLVDFDYKTLAPAQLPAWQAFFGRASKNWGWFIFCFFQIVNMVGTSSGHGNAFAVVFAVAIVALLMFGVIFSRSEWRVRAATKGLSNIAERWKKEADPTLYSDALIRFEEIANSLRDVKTQYERDRQAYIELIHQPELERHLSKYKILIADAGPIGWDKLSYLFEKGIETAADVTDERFRMLPRIQTNQEKQHLKAWRKSLEAQFWKSHNYKLTIHQERNLIVQIRKENDRKRAELDEAPAKLEELADRLRSRQDELANEAEKYVAVLRRHGPRLLALEGKKAN